VSKLAGSKVILKSGFASKQFAAAALMTALLALGTQSQAGDLSLPVTGDILGTVVDNAGIPQMGATVNLFNRYERLIAKTMTAADGRFAFAGLPADVYSIRVSLASFLPAARNRIAIRAGMDSMLEIHLATLFSNVQVHYAAPTAAMTNDWKWALRSSPATRLVTRYLPDEVSNSSMPELRPRIFSGTHAIVSVSGGDAGFIDDDSMQGDMGTRFLLSTNILGKNQLQVAGTYGPNANFGPASMGLCAIYSRGGDNGFGEPPEIAFTVSQFGLSGGASQTPPNVQPGGVIRIMSLSAYQVFDPADNVHIEYGVTGESVDFANQHTSRVSPFARATVGVGNAGQVVAAYSDGDRPEELLAHQPDQPVAPLEASAPGDDSLAAVANGLARMPQLSNREGTLELQRARSYELGFSRTAGSRTYAVSAFHEDVWNGAVNMAGDLASIQGNDLLSDGISQTSAYDIGQYRRNGYLVSVNERTGDLFDVALAYGRMGGFTKDPESLMAVLNGATGILAERNENLAAVNIKAKVPKGGTQIWTNYGWFANGAMIPQHLFMTQSAYAAPGLSVFVRQPLPSFFGIPGRVELTADLRNLLAQGYIPLGANEGRTILVVQSPRMLRGGLNFVF
jgi:hypothetical protein